MQNLFLPILILLAGCSGMRSSPETRYQGMFLNARELGEEVLEQAEESDSNVAQFVAKTGKPDFIMLASPNDVELVYARKSLLAHFHRASAEDPTTVTEVTPLPGGLANLLPDDLRAGTGARLDPSGPWCWTTSPPATSCRTCCKAPLACVIDCQPTKR